MCLRAQVYPGGFVWVYAGLRKWTNDGKVRAFAWGGKVCEQGGWDEEEIRFLKV